MLGCKSIDTPIKQNHRLRESKEDAAVDCGRYQRLVGNQFTYHIQGQR